MVEYGYFCTLLVVSMNHANMCIVIDSGTMNKAKYSKSPSDQFYIKDPLLYPSSFTFYGMKGERGRRIFLKPSYGEVPKTARKIFYANRS